MRSLREPAGGIAPRAERPNACLSGIFLGETSPAAPGFLCHRYRMPRFPFPPLAVPTPRSQKCNTAVGGASEASNKRSSTAAFQAIVLFIFLVGLAAWHFTVPSSVPPLDRAPGLDHGSHG